MKITECLPKNWDTYLYGTWCDSPYVKTCWFETVTQFFGGRYALYQIDLGSHKFLFPCFFGTPWSPFFRVGSIGYGGPLCAEPTEYQVGLMNRQEMIKGLEAHLQLPCTGVTGYPSYERSEVLVEPAQEEVLSPTCELTLEEALNPIDQEGFLKSYDGSIRTALRKSQKEGIIVRRLDADTAPQAWQLLVDTQIAVGASYQTPWPFFKALALERGSFAGGYGAFLGPKLIASAILLYSETEAVHYVHGWDRAFAKTCANQALIHRMLQDASKLGCRRFNLGESPQTSLLKAKRKWGGDCLYVSRLAFPAALNVYQPTRHLHETSATKQG